MSKTLLFPEDIRAALIRRFDNAWRSWLSEGNSFPITLSLGVPTESYVADDAAGVRSWVDAWAGWTGAGSVRWVDRQWGRLGRQRLPASLELASAREVASIAGQDGRWDIACERFGRLSAGWPLAAGSGLARCFDLLADYADADFDRLLAFLRWVDHHPNSGLYLRQLPIEGLDTKWVESRKGLLSRLLRLLRELRRSSKLPVLMLTALGEDIDRILEYQCNAEAEEASGAFPRDPLTWYAKPGAPK